MCIASESVVRIVCHYIAMAKIRIDSHVFKISNSCSNTLECKYIPLILRSFESMLGQIETPGVVTRCQASSEVRVQSRC